MISHKKDVLKLNISETSPICITYLIIRNDIISLIYVIIYIHVNTVYLPTRCPYCEKMYVGQTNTSTEDKMWT
jgi:hypothetical protein